MGLARDDEPTQVTRLRNTLRMTCAAEALELDAVRTSAVDIGREARARPSSSPHLRLALTPEDDVEEDSDGDETGQGLETSEDGSG